MATSTTLPLLSAAPADAPFAWRDGAPIARRQFVADACRLAARLPAAPVLALTADRYRFALALAAAALRGQFNLLPPNHTPDTLRRLRELFPGAYALVEPGAGSDPELPSVPFDVAAATDPPSPQIPALGAGAIVARVLTSGSTGTPTAHPKRWGLLAVNLAGATARIAALLGRRAEQGLAGCNFVGTVPAHHMYGFESTVLVAFFAGAAFAAERPFFPAEIVQSLERLPRPRILVTTPLHLKTLLESGVAAPALDLVMSATDVLPPALAVQAEDRLRAPLLEIYGCTEAGQVASRRTIEGGPWQCLGDLTVAAAGDGWLVQGGHVEQPTPLADFLDLVSPTTFHLRGRSNDLVNIAGKRGSLSHLNHQLRSVAGVRDGAFWMPSDADGTCAASAGSNAVRRLVALVVLDGLSPPALLAELRQRIDAAFLPRRIIQVASLPRDPTGKLPAARLADLARAALTEGS